MLVNKYKDLEKMYLGKRWVDITKDFIHYDTASHSVKYENQMYFIICDRFDRCIAVNIIES